MARPKSFVTQVVEEIIDRCTTEEGIVERDCEITKEWVEILFNVHFRDKLIDQAIKRLTKYGFKVF